MKLYAVLDASGNGYITNNKSMAQYAKTGLIPHPYSGVNPIASAMRELIFDGGSVGVELFEIELPNASDHGAAQ